MSRKGDRRIILSERPQDTGNPDTSYTADVFVVNDDGTVEDGIKGSTYPNSKSNKDNTTSYNTVVESSVSDGGISFNNKSGHSEGTQKGLNLVTEDSGYTG